MQAKNRPKTLTEYAQLDPVARSRFPESIEFGEVLSSMLDGGAYRTDIAGVGLTYVIERRGGDVCGLLSTEGLAPMVIVRDHDDEVTVVHGIANDVRQRRAAAKPKTKAAALKWDPKKARNPHPEKPHPWEPGYAGPNPVPAAPESPAAPTRGQIASAVVDQADEIARLDTALAVQGAQIARLAESIEAITRDLGTLVERLTAPANAGS